MVISDPVLGRLYNFVSEMVLNKYLHIEYTKGMGIIVKAFILSNIYDYCILKIIYIIWKTLRDAAVLILF